MKLKNIVLAVSLAAGLLGCQSAFEFTNEQKNAPLRPDVKERMQALRGNTYVREIRTEDVAKSRPVFKSGQGLILREVLAETLPGYAIIPKGQADLNQPVDVMASGMSVADFIEYVEGTLDLDIKILGNRIIVSSFETREWNLAAFASTRNVNNVIASTQTRGAQAGESDEGASDTGTGTSTGNIIGFTLSEDEWTKILEGARKIIGVEEEVAPGVGANAALAAVGMQTGAAPFVPGQDPGLNFDSGSAGGYAPNLGVAEAKPYIEGIRSVGIVTAGGKPSKMKVLDRYLKRAIAESTKVINVQVEAYDVLLNDGKQKGIDWNLLIDSTVNGNPLGLDFFNTSPSSDDPFWNVKGTYQSDKVTATALVRFLENYGRVELKDQPNLTVRNGVPAQIYAGEELTYIVDVEQSQDVNGNATVTPKLGRLKVGVTLSLTVRVLDNDQLLVDVWPVISNLNKADTIMIGDYSFETPRVNLKEFSTQLVASSGQSVHMGGLITKRMNEALRQLPWQNLVSKAVLNPLTQGINNSLERRELVLVVTPTLVEGVF
ncbi:type II secretion system protein GspD [Pseudomonas aeruginosa]|jgi:type II secretory pathway component GspD/PulD (secretin)|uniref:type II secretion system protein GspD n=1 Tax=Pseudomonas aeruginosa TaxID=287 RepID=UPI001A25A94A|nr:pilus assembly protein [Pseudomonas aeruginosa]MBH8699607.1 pilus assembly protein [Pseudomonas aeruginosa]WBM10728.1 type II and III secretion system protein [Pseudomonas aeruginosa]HCL4130909.1 pilus assembly protein [Pseudomonas aeruginosa]HEK3610246.1 pilus assembly protein [Pseudomonas aeruginosa]